MEIDSSTASRRANAFHLRGFVTRIGIARMVQMKTSVRKHRAKKTNFGASQTSVSESNSSAMEIQTAVSRTAINVMPCLQTQ